MIGVGKMGWLDIAAMGLLAVYIVGAVALLYSHPSRPRPRPATSDEEVSETHD